VEPDDGRPAFESSGLDDEGEGRDLAERLAVDAGLRARLASYAWRRFGILSADVADILQETCLSLLFSRGHIDHPEAFACTVFHRRCCAAVGSSVRARGLPASPEALFGDQSMEDSIWLRQALARLSPRRPELIHSYFFEGHSLRETARLCGVAESGVWTLLSRSVEKLRVEMIGRSGTGHLSTVKSASRQAAA
jgi:RNA polymerase sigma factor (sigma-70 family)